MPEPTEEQKRISRMACEEELKFILRNPLSRRFFWRLLTEHCLLDVTSFPQNAGIYALCGKQQIGRELLRAARVIDLDNVQQAERDYYDLQERLHEAAKNDKEKQNG